MATTRRNCEGIDKTDLGVNLRPGCRGKLDQKKKKQMVAKPQQGECLGRRRDEQSKGKQTVAKPQLGDCLEKWRDEQTRGKQNVTRLQQGQCLEGWRGE